MREQNLQGVPMFTAVSKQRMHRVRSCAHQKNYVMELVEKYERTTIERAEKHRKRKILCGAMWGLADQARRNRLASQTLEIAGLWFEGFWLNERHASFSGEFRCHRPRSTPSLGRRSYGQGNEDLSRAEAISSSEIGCIEEPFGIEAIIGDIA
jgi:hypothetical protein